jgi:hypothetical protein
VKNHDQPICEEQGLGEKAFRRSLFERSRTPAGVL